MLFVFATHLECKYCYCSILYYIVLFILLFLPGRGRLHVKPLLVALVIILCMDQAHSSNVFTIDDLDYLFGANGCIEGIAFFAPFIACAYLFLIVSLCCVSAFILPYVRIFICILFYALFLKCKVIFKR
jgi:hypothetical protein